MAKRKTFEQGQLVEVQREPMGRWESAVYEKPYGIDFKGHHSVRLSDASPPRWIDSSSGNECAATHPRAYRTHHLCVPSRRLRAARAKERP